VLPVVTVRQALYTDPRKPVSVESGVKEIGTVNESSPVLVTTNFALTYYTVANDIESSGVNCYLIVADTEGLAVEVGVAGGQFNATKINDALSTSKLSEKINHKKMVIPGRAARLKGDIEDTTGWEVMIGPQDSSEIGGFIKKQWETAK
jgi:acetyl-CoA decarbonylase/synthase complex subunit gamma